MTKLYSGKDVDKKALKKARIAILGYGSQGRAHALNLADSGHDVVVGVRKKGASWKKAKKDGLKVAEPNDAADGADLVAMLVPDLAQADLYKSVEKSLKKGATLLYFAAADISRDLASELSARGFHVVTQTVYRMAQVAHLPREVCDGFAANAIDAVLHYSRRSAEAFVAAARDDGVEISALAVPHHCISASVAEVLREAGAARVTVAARPDENKLLEGLTRALRC